MIDIFVPKQFKESSSPLIAAKINPLPKENVPRPVEKKIGIQKLKLAQITSHSVEPTPRNLASPEREDTALDLNANNS